MIEKTRQNIDCPDELWAFIRVEAAKRNVTISECVVWAVCKGFGLEESKFFESGKFKGSRRRGNPIQPKADPKKRGRKSTIG